MSHAVDDFTPDVAPEVRGRAYSIGACHFLVIDGALAEPRLPRFFDFLREMGLEEWRQARNKWDVLEHEYAAAQDDAPPPQGSAA